jgi:DNA-binding NarL/FixJ family response regulator
LRESLGVVDAMSRPVLAESTIDLEFAVQSLDTTLPPGRQTLQAKPGQFAGWTALLVDPTRELSHTLQEGMLSSGAGEVLLAGSENEVDQILRCRSTAGDLAVVSVRLGKQVDVVIRQLRQAGWDRVLLFSPVGDIASTVAAIGAGATGVLCWPAPFLEFPLPQPTRCLSKREKDVLTLVAEGMTNPQIGRELNLAPSTVKRHIARIGSVIGSGNRSQIVAIALRAGIL